MCEKSAKQILHLQLNLQIAVLFKLVYFRQICFYVLIIIWTLATFIVAV